MRRGGDDSDTWVSARPRSRTPFERNGLPAWDSTVAGKASRAARRPASPAWSAHGRAWASPQQPAPQPARSRSLADAGGPPRSWPSYTQAPLPRTRGGSVPLSGAEADRLSSMIDDNRELLRELQLRGRSGGAAGPASAPAPRAVDAWHDAERPLSAPTTQHGAEPFVPDVGDEGGAARPTQLTTSERLAALQARVDAAEARARAAAESAEQRATAAEREAGEWRDAYASLQAASECDRAESLALAQQLRTLQGWSHETAEQLQSLRAAASELTAAGAGAEAARADAARARAQMAAAQDAAAEAQRRATAALRDAAQSAERCAGAKRAEASARRAAQSAEAVAAAALQALRTLKDALARAVGAGGVIDAAALAALREELEAHALLPEPAESSDEERIDYA
jgi:hypothetical protein